MRQTVAAQQQQLLQVQGAQQQQEHDAGKWAALERKARRAEEVLA
jgi:hypothetical protein